MKMGVVRAIGLDLLALRNLIFSDITSVHTSRVHTYYIIPTYMYAFQAFN